MASVWVPFTSESKEAIASYPEIEKELRLALQAVGRKLGMYLRLRSKVRQEGERRSIFLRYLGEVAQAVSEINGFDRGKLYDRLLQVAKRKTVEADTQLDDRGRRLLNGDEDFGDNVLIVEQSPEDLLGSGESNGQANGARQLELELDSPDGPPAPRRKK